MAIPTTTEFQVTEADFQLVREVLYKHCGISLGDEKQAMVRARLAKQIRSGGFASAAEYLDYALADRSSDAFTGLINALTTNLTSFFREPEHFKYLTETAMPALLKRKAESSDSRLLVWSAACSSGEEPYTIGITILESLERLRPVRKIDLRILATDISTNVLARAQAGIYDAARMANVPQGYAAKYFSAGRTGGAEGNYTVTDALRTPVRFRHLNLLGPWPFKGPFDFIFCRNVMIYFDKPTQQDLVNRMWNCLAPGGLLFTGHSESLTRISHRFANRLPSIYEKCV